MQTDYIAYARRLVSDTAVIEALRGLEPANDAELERVYWNGCGGIRGSVVSALYPLIKRFRALGSGQIAELASRDEERVRLLAQNLKWEDSHKKSD